MSFFVLDLETLGVESTSVVLSIGMVYCDPELLSEDNTEAYNQLLKESCLIKFNAKEQSASTTNRTISKATLDWWQKQGEIPRMQAMTPTPEDMNAVEGLTKLRKWFNSYKDAKKLPIWVRGSLDQPTFESLCRSFDVEPFVMYNCYRDVRTAIDLIYDEGKGGYVEIPDFDSDIVIKHNPVHDSAYDALMLIRGKQ